MQETHVNVISVCIVALLNRNAFVGECYWWWFAVNSDQHAVYAQRHRGK